MQFHEIMMDRHCLVFWIYFVLLVKKHPVRWLRSYLKYTSPHNLLMRDLTISITGAEYLARVPFHASKILQLVQRNLCENILKWTIIMN